MTSRRRVRFDDAGAYIVLYALLATALFTVAAVVLDLAALRQGRRADRAAADLAATAGASVLDPLVPSSAAAACQTAWDYVVLNRDAAEGAVSAPPCSATFSGGSPCDPVVASTATGTLGPLTVSITYPVPDTSPLMQAEVQGGDRPQAPVASFDGPACGRVAVRVQRTRRFLFGGLAGTPSGSTDVHAVARASVQPGTVVPGIVSVETTGCDGVSLSSDGGRLEVDPSGDGLVVVDSDASGCGAGGFAVSAPSPSALRAGGGAGGGISSFALAGPGFAQAWSGDVVPAPTPALARTGRSFLDVRYNCGPPCGQAQGALDALRSSLGPVGGPGEPVFQYSGTVPGSCVVDAADVVELPVDVRVPCDASVGGLRVDGRLTLHGSTNVFDGGVVVTADGCLAVNDAACGSAVTVAKDSVLYVRAGDVAVQWRGAAVLGRVFGYLASGVVRVDVGHPALPDRIAWTAPLAGDFEDLMGWSDSGGGVSSLSEQQSTQYEGTFVQPGGTVVLEGKPGSSTTQALQLVAARVRLQGSGTFELQPSSLRATGLVARIIKLIR